VDDADHDLLCLMPSRSCSRPPVSGIAPGFWGVGIWL
jgi:hypothetical protein